MGDKNVEELAKELSKEIIKEMLPDISNKLKHEIIRDIQREKKKKILHNTYVLMKNYNTFKNHVKKVKVREGMPIDYDKYMKQLNEENMMEIYITDEKFIKSILVSKIRTATIVAFLDEALSIIKKEYKDKKKYERYRAFELFFIKGYENSEICEELFCSKNIPRKWSNEVLKDLSLLLWGIDALNEVIA